MKGAETLVWWGIGGDVELAYVVHKQSVFHEVGFGFFSDSYPCRKRKANTRF